MLVAGRLPGVLLRVTVGLAGEVTRMTAISDLLDELAIAPRLEGSLGKSKLDLFDVPGRARGNPDVLEVPRVGALPGPAGPDRRSGPARMVMAGKAIPDRPHFEPGLRVLEKLTAIAEFHGRPISVEEVIEGLGVGRGYALCILTREAKLGRLTKGGRVPGPMGKPVAVYRAA